MGKDGFCKNFSWFSRSNNASSGIEEPRKIKFKHSNESANRHSRRNKIVTHKYTILTFLPKNLYGQLKRFANCYFLVAAGLSFIIHTPAIAFLSAFPLIFVLTITAIKQGYEDYQLYVEDKKINHTLVKVIRNKSLCDIQCQNIAVGDLVKVTRNEDVPCDLILLQSSDNDNFCCYVTTANLDGETNLKAVYVPKIFSGMSIESLISLEGILTYQQPKADLYCFHGTLELDENFGNRSGHFTIENLLMKGSKLKDTDFIIGYAIYTGPETKLALNSKVPNKKLSTSDRSINNFLLMFIFLLLVCIASMGVLKIFHDTHNEWRNEWLKDPEDKEPNLWNRFTGFVKACLSFMILFQYVVPISLYVTAELQKFLSSLFFEWDFDLYDEETDQPAIANTSDLNEELGQVEYLLCDKTGTLTENAMIFRSCYISEKVYIENNCDGILRLLSKNGNGENAKTQDLWEPDVWNFFIGLSICHDVHKAPPDIQKQASIKRSEYRESMRKSRNIMLNSSLSMEPGLPEYEAISADEKALVEASARLGVIFDSNTKNSLSIRLKSKKTYIKFEKLQVLEFTSSRKRMSVIVKGENNVISLYSKGADSSIFPLIKEGNVEEAKKYVSEFSKVKRQKGYRTLVIGYKTLSETEYKAIEANVKNARQTFGVERNDCIESAFDNAEIGLTLLGVTGVEDRLQDEVPETIKSLKIAGIKIWILTGDKAETAENIALSCGHFEEEVETLRLTNQRSKEECFAALLTYERIIKMEQKKWNFLMDGFSLAFVDESCEELLRNIARSCEAVLCARLSPLQKSEIVKILKNAPDCPITAAIGDGGNDVSMINEAHIGIGIIGKEGRQAAMSADFAITKFRHLQKALLVHGHWYYERISVLILYFFYKNMVFVLPQVCYSFSNGFSTQSLYDVTYMMLFNMMFTSLPILVYGLCEQKYSAKELLENPALYRENQRNQGMSFTQFFIWNIIGLWHGFLIFGFPFFYVWSNPFSIDNFLADRSEMGTFIFQMVIIITTTQVFIHSSYKTTLLLISVVVSDLSFALIATICSIIPGFDADMYGSYLELMANRPCWILTFFILIVAFFPTMIFTYVTGFRQRFSNVRLSDVFVFWGTKKQTTQQNHVTSFNVPLEIMNDM